MTAEKQNSITKSKPGPKPKEKDNTKKVSRHFGIPMDLYNEMEQENLMDKKNSGERISTEETLITLISEGLLYRKEKREAESRKTS